jgi:Protein of unknown function (DUF4012)
MAETVGEAPVSPRALSSTTRTRLVMLTLAVLLVSFLGYKLWRLSLILGDASSRVAALSISHAAGLDLTRPSDLAEQLRLLGDDLRSLRGELGPLVYLGPLAAWVPRYGGDAAQAPALLEYGDSIVNGASAAVGLFGSVTSEMDSGRLAGQPTGRSALVVLARHQGDVQKARTELDRALAARSAVQASTLSPRMRELIDRSDSLFPLWSAGLNALQVAPDLLGANGARVYLLIVQNSDELRPTGGFISSVVRVRVENGDVSTLDFSDSYAIDNPQVSHPDAPPPLQHYMDAGMWVVRDANWSPDYPTAARDIEHLYQLDRGVASDGVIAVDLKMVPHLLEAFGPVDVEGYVGPVDSGNVEAKLKEYWASPQGQGQTGDWWLHRKDFSGQLLVTLLERLRADDFDREQLARVLSDALASKDLLLYTNDPAAEARLEAAGWAGSLSAGQGDRLMIADSNLGFNKVDPSVDRAADYTVELDRSGGEHSKLTLNYTNRSPDNGTLCIHAPNYPPTYAEMEQGCYWDYLRVVAAPGSQLLSTTEGLDTGSDDPIRGRSVFHGYFILPRGASRAVEYDYQTPQVVSDGRTWRLRLESQPGAPARQMHVSIKLPEDWADWSATPAPQKVSGRVIEYELTLDRDTDIVVMKDGAPPLTLVIGLGLGGFSLVSAGLWLLGRSQRRRSAGREIKP